MPDRRAEVIVMPTDTISGVYRQARDAGMPDEEPTNILVVDDLPEKILVYRSILDELGQKLVTVNSGEEALRAVLQQDFAVILLDVNMPGMSGLETAALIRGRKRSAHTPIIFLTAFADEVHSAEGYAHGAVDYITTPVVPAILRAKVRVFAELHRLSRQIQRQADQRIVLAAERMKREAAEDENRRLGILARAGAMLGRSLDPEVTVRHVLEVVTPELADAAALVRLPLDGRPGQCHESHRATTLPPTDPFLPTDPDLAKAVSCFLNDPDAPLSPGSAVALPLTARERTIAVLALSRVPSGRSFAAADLTVATTVVSRAAIAIENALLYHEVQRADRQKNEFLAMLAHELRNPLAPIRNANVVLGHQASDPARVMWAHRVIERQLGYLIRLVDDLLDMSRITLGKIRLADELVDLSAAMTQAVEATRPLIDQLRHTIEVILPSSPLCLRGDHARLAQVFINLLTNAAKYTEAGGRIRFAASLEGGQAVVRVQDSGVGIAAELLPEVFELFTQANRSLDRSQGGLGIGLTLVRRLVELHGGSVDVTSEGLGRGSEFSVRLPVAASATPSPTSDAASHRLNGKQSGVLRVVVVDDNVDSADSLADLLRLLGHEVTVAYNGPDGIAAVKQFGPQLVLLDIGLPGMDGFEVARRLRKEVGSDIVLAAVTGYGQEADLKLTREVGFNHHFVKPIEFSMLRSLLDSVVQKSPGPAE